MKREPIYQALFDRINEIDGISTCSRILQHWDDVSPNMQPALFLAQDSQAAEQVTGYPTKYVLGAKLWVYTHRDTNGQVPATQINNILDAVDGALAPDPMTLNKQTLGGLVEHCWISGSIDTDEGLLGNQDVAIVPISMLVVAS